MPTKMLRDELPRIIHSLQISFDQAYSRKFEPMPPEDFRQNRSII